MSGHVYVDETKRSGYVLTAASVADPEAARKAVRALVRPGNRRLHMVDERPHRRAGIVASVVATGIDVTVYDAARRYRTDREARAACLAALVGDLAGAGGNSRMVIEQDETLIQFDRRELYRLLRRAGIADRIEYHHQRAHEEPLLALPDVVAWCWVRSGEWRRRIRPILAGVRTV